MRPYIGRRRVVFKRIVELASSGLHVYAVVKALMAEFGLPRLVAHLYVGAAVKLGLVECSPRCRPLVDPGVFSTLLGLAKIRTEARAARLHQLLSSRDCSTSEELAAAMGLTASQIQTALELLMRAGLVEAELRGRKLCYRASRRSASILDALCSEFANARGGVACNIHKRVARRLGLNPKRVRGMLEELGLGLDRSGCAPLSEIRRLCR